MAFGLIRTRLTEVPAGGDGKIDIQGRQLAVGVNPELLESMAHGMPLGRAGTTARRRRGGLPVLHTSSRTTSAVRSLFAAAGSLPEVGLAQSGREPCAI